MKRLSLIVLVLCFTFAAPVTATDKDKKFWVQGPVSCGEWISARKEDRIMVAAFEFWIIGYITAFNAQKPDVYNIMGSTDTRSVYLWMDKYCRENPISYVHSGMQVLTVELWPNRKRTADD